MATEHLSSLACDLSLRALNQQEAALNELRARTGTLLTASALVVSFLGSRAFAVSSSRALTVVGLVAFVASVAGSVYVLFPKCDLVFAFSGSVLFEHEFGQAGGLEQVERRVSYWIDSYRSGNQALIDRMFFSYRLATVAVSHRGHTVERATDGGLMSDKPSNNPA